MATASTPRPLQSKKPARPVDRPVEGQTTPRRKLRILGLHGRCTNAKVMINQTKGLRDAIGEENAEFIFIDAPFLAVGEIDPVIERAHGKDAPFYEWWYARAIPGTEMGKDQWLWIMENFDEIVAFMDKKLQEIGPVDVVVGFSQGSVLLTALSMLYLERDQQAPWKLSMCIGGVSLQCLEFRNLVETPDGRQILVPIPSIHIIGREDFLYEENVRLADSYDSHTTIFPSSPLKKMVVFHDGGHRFPSPRKYKELYGELARVIIEHCHACDQGSDNLAFARL